MFKCDHAKLTLSFNEFHEIEAKDMPQYGEFCLLALKDGRFTAGDWHPQDSGKKSAAGQFIRGTADSIDASEVAKWHSLERYDLTDCLMDEEMGYINLGHEEEGIYSVQFGDFKLLTDGDYPKSEQYCLLILNNGGLAAGRWDEWSKNEGGSFIYAPALASYDMDEVWAWTALSSDDIFEMEEESERERKREAELNLHPTADPELLRYGTDIDVYYEKALEKLRGEYPWATMTQMKKRTPYVIAPCHGQLVFGQISRSYDDRDIVAPWTEGSSADEFIDFLCEYTKTAVQDSDPEKRFKYGTDIGVYLEKAYENVKKDYRWLDRAMLETECHFAIREVGGEPEFVRWYDDEEQFSVVDCGSAERFIEIVEYDYQRAALRANPVVAQYDVPFKPVVLHGWNLEKYVFSKLQTGDYKVSVQAGNRVTGGSRDFFITPYCFEAETYEEFLDRYLEIVPGHSFGLYKEDLIKDEKLKKFLGYH